MSGIRMLPGSGPCSMSQRGGKDWENRTSHDAGEGSMHIKEDVLYNVTGASRGQGRFSAGGGGG